MKAAMLAHDLILAGSAGVVVAGGMESMSNAPYLLPKARGGYRMGHGQVLDHMFLDGLEDAYDKGRLMGTFAEDCAEANGFTGKTGQLLVVPTADGAPEQALFGAGEAFEPMTARGLPFFRPTSAAAQTSSYGVRLDPFTRRPAFHSGLDFAGPNFTPIYATAPGVVSFAGVRSGYGNTVEIEHELLAMNRNSVEYEFLSEVVSRNIKQLKLYAYSR